MRRWRRVFGCSVDLLELLVPLFMVRTNLAFECVGKHILGYREKTILQPWRGPNGEVIYEPE